MEGAWEPAIDLMLLKRNSNLTHQMFVRCILCVAIVLGLRIQVREIGLGLKML